MRLVGENDIHAVFFRCGIGSKCQIQDVITIQGGLRANLEKGRFDSTVAHETYLSPYNLLHYSNYFPIRQYKFAFYFMFYFQFHLLLKDIKK